MKVSSAFLGLIAMAASPFLFAEMYVLQNRDNNTSSSGIFDLLYMIGWTCTIVGLLRLGATGVKRSGKMILYVQLVLLTIANTWNIWTAIDPGNTSLLHFIMDFSWPLSNICLLIAGIVIAYKGILQGWKRYAVLMAGLWLPLNIILMLIFGNSSVSFLISGIYSMVTWFIMGLMIYRERCANVRIANVRIGVD